MRKMEVNDFDMSDEVSQNTCVCSTVCSMVAFTRAAIQVASNNCPNHGYLDINPNNGRHGDPTRVLREFVVMIAQA